MLEDIAYVELTEKDMEEVLWFLLKTTFIASLNLRNFSDCRQMNGLV